MSPSLRKNQSTHNSNRFFYLELTKLEHERYQPLGQCGFEFFSLALQKTFILILISI